VRCAARIVESSFMYLAGCLNAWPTTLSGRLAAAVVGAGGPQRRFMMPEFDNLITSWYQAKTADQCLSCDRWFLFKS